MRDPGSGSRPPQPLRFYGFDVEDVLGELCELLVGRAFLVERLLKQPRDLVVAEQLGVGVKRGCVVVVDDALAP